MSESSPYAFKKRIDILTRSLEETKFLKKRKKNWLNIYYISGRTDSNLLVMREERKEREKERRRKRDYVCSLKSEMKSSRTILGEFFIFNKSPTNSTLIPISRRSAVSSPRWSVYNDDAKTSSLLHVLLIPEVVIASFPSDRPSSSRGDNLRGAPFEHRSARNVTSRRARFSCSIRSWM